VLPAAAAGRRPNLRSTPLGEGRSISKAFGSKKDRTLMLRTCNRIVQQSTFHIICAHDAVPPEHEHIPKLAVFPAMDRNDWNPAGNKAAQAVRKRSSMPVRRRSRPAVGLSLLRRDMRMARTFRCLLPSRSLNGSRRRLTCL
jgi:hypothetical protein